MLIVCLKLETVFFTGAGTLWSFPAMEHALSVPGIFCWLKQFKPPAQIPIHYLNLLLKCSYNFLTSYKRMRNLKISRLLLVWAPNVICKVTQPYTGCKFCRILFFEDHLQAPEGYKLALLQIRVGHFMCSISFAVYRQQFSAAHWFHLLDELHAVVWLLLLRLSSSVDSACLRACYSGSGTRVCITSLALWFLITHNFPQGSSNFPAALAVDIKGFYTAGSVPTADSNTAQLHATEATGAPSACRSAEFG